MGTIQLAAAWQAHEQAAADLRMALDDAMSHDRVSNGLAMATCLTSLRYIEKHGLTEEGRRKLRTAIASCRAAMGIET